MSITQYGSIKFTGTHPNMIPDGDGDLFYEQDRIRDFAWLWDRVGSLANDFTNLGSSSGFIIYGGWVSKGTGETFNIAAGIGYAGFAVDVGNSAAVPPATGVETISAVRISWEDGYNVGTVAGTTTYYVKVKYNETDGLLRTRARVGGTWYFTKTPSYLFVIDTSVPNTREILLATVTVVSGAISSIVNANIASITGLKRYAPVSGYTPTAGDVVEMYGDGKIRKAIRSNSAIVESGSTVVAMRVAAITDTQAVVIYTVGLALKAVVVTVNPNDLSLAFGTAVTVVTHTTLWSPAAISKVNSTTMLVAYCIRGFGFYQLSVVTLSISGDAITVNTPVNGAAAATMGDLAAIPGGTNSFLTYSTATTTIWGAVVSVSGTVPTINTPVSLTVTATPAQPTLQATVLADGSQGACMTRASASPGVLYFNWWGISGTTVSAGGTISLGMGSMRRTEDSVVGGKSGFIIYNAGYEPAGASADPMISGLQRTRKPTGATMYAGSPIPMFQVSSSLPGFPRLVCVDADSQVFVLGPLVGPFAGATWVTFRLASGPADATMLNQYVFGDEFAVTTATVNTLGGISALASGIVLLCAATNAASTSRLYALRRRNAIIGIAVDNLGTVRSSGVYVYGGGGLTPGATYGVADNGSFTTAVGEARVGVALSATELLVNVIPGV